MKKEDFIKLGVTEEVARKCEDLVSGYVSKGDFDNKEAERLKLEDDIKTMDKELDDLKKSKGDTEELTKQIYELQASSNEKDKEYKTKLENVIKTNAIKTELLKLDNKPYDIDLVMGLLNCENVQIKDGVIEKGFSEQIEAIVKDKGFLFDRGNVDKNGRGENNGNKGISFKGGEPNLGADKGNIADNDSAFGKSLAHGKLNMLGINTSIENKGE